MQPWRRIEPTITTKIDYHTVVIKTFQTPEHKVVTRAIFHGDDVRCACVIAVTKDRKVVVAEQFRPGPEKVMLELPGGGIEPNEDPEVAARRELREETGYVPETMTFLGKFPRDAYVGGWWFCYLATDCELEGDQELDEHELVNVHLMDIDAFLENAKQGNMTDPFAVLAAYEQLKKLQGDQG